MARRRVVAPGLPPPAQVVHRGPLLVGLAAELVAEQGLSRLHLAGEQVRQHPLGAHQRSDAILGARRQAAGRAFLLVDHARRVHRGLKHGILGQPGERRVTEGGKQARQGTRRLPAVEVAVREGVLHHLCVDGVVVVVVGVLVVGVGVRGGLRGRAILFVDVGDAAVVLGVDVVVVAHRASGLLVGAELVDDVVEVGFGLGGVLLLGGRHRALRGAGWTCRERGR